MNEDKITGDGSFREGQIAFATCHVTGLRHYKTDMREQYELVPSPKGPDSDKHFTPAFSFNFACLPANSAEPEGLIALFEFLYRRDDEEVRFNPAMQNYIELSMTSKQQYDVINYCAEQWQGEGDPYQGMGGNSMWKLLTEPLEAVLTGEKGAVAAMNEIAPEAQVWLDDVFGQ